MIDLPSSGSLAPQEYRLSGGQPLYAYRGASTDLVKLDLMHEAGSAYQPQRLCAAAANNLYTAATRRMTSEQVAEMLDFRGIIVEPGADVLQCTTTFYFLRRYADELLPLVDQCLREPAFAEEDFEVYRHRRRQELMAGARKGSAVARRLFYEALYGPEHPLGSHAEAADAGALDIAAVRRFFAERYRVGNMGVALAGQVDDRLVEAIDALWGGEPREAMARIGSLSPTAEAAPQRLFMPVEGAVQGSLRIGRVLPIGWDHPDYAPLVILTALLGGYFGSRLMTNIREEKGFTYGIYARTQIYRDSIVFYITSDVAQGTSDAAVDEALGELRRLCDMLGTGVEEAFTDRLAEALRTATPGSLRDLARRYLDPGDMTVCVAGCR